MVLASAEKAISHMAATDHPGNAGDEAWWKVLVMESRATLVVLLVGLVACENEQARLERERDIKSMEAYVMCQEFVGDLLVSPGSAEYPPGGKAESVGGNRWRVVSHVDAQNRMGAFLRANFYCEIEDVGDDQWRAIDVRLLE